MTDVDALVVALDAANGGGPEQWEKAAKIAYRWANWDLCRTTSGWMVILRSGAGQAKNIRGATIAEALTAAADVRFCPVVPKQPTVARFELGTKRDGSSPWRLNVVYPGSYPSDAGASFRTKREATERAAEWTEKSARQYEEWLRDWAHLVEHGVEGVDWEWSDR